MRTRVKICGLTNASDALVAVDLGADAVGFVLWPKSPRFVPAAGVADIVSRLPPFVTRVGVFVDASPVDVADAVREARLDVAQLHGAVDPAECAEAAGRLLCSTSLQSDQEVEIVAAWPSAVMPIVDAHDPVRHGGTGQRADWVRAAILAARRPVVLAGGLTPDNVAEAITRVRPWAVDVSSGVETTPGRKSPERLAAFFAAVAAAEGVDR
jgi:phosphoribosylanthranilate isomerase